MPNRYSWLRSYAGTLPKTGRKKGQKTERQKAMAGADKWFRMYTRLRDADDNGWCKCISCGKPVKWNRGCDGGHYINCGQTSVRFNEDNCHAQCVSCNRFGEGEQVRYKIHLETKIGVRRVNLLHALKGKRYYHIHELNAIKDKYRELCKELKKEKGL